jgi:DNA-binding transcriptional LysR family regulator
MLNFSHHVFYEVAKQLSFSKAAQQLFISQPAISKHIKTLEENYQVTLFERMGHTIALTQQGTLLFNYLKKATELERQLEFEITSFTNKKQARGSLTIGASTTVALYVIPKVLSSFHQQFPDIQLRLMNRNSENILKALMDHEIDFGIIEGKNKLTAAKYKFFLTDEVIPVCSARSDLTKQKKITIEELPGIPVALRERGSGTLAAITVALEKNGIKINDFHSRIILGGTEALKNFLLDDTCIGFLPLRSVTKELKSGSLVRLQIPGLQITREFYFVQRQGSENDKINNLFIKMAQQHYNKK